MHNQSRKLLTITEAAQLLSIKVSRLRTAVFRMEVPFVKIGRLVRFREEDLLKWVEANTQGTKDKEDSWFF